MGALMALGRIAIVGHTIKDLYAIAGGLGLLLIIGVIIVCYVMYLKYESARIESIRKQQFQPVRQIEAFKQFRAGNNSYNVHEDLENPEEAAQLLDKLNTTAHQLIDHLTEKYLENDGINTIKPDYRKKVIYGIQSLKRNYRTPSLQENIPERSGGDTSFVIDKGTVFAMCLRDPKNNNQLETKYNSLVFVLVHEMAHLFCPKWGHPPLFWENFKFLLQESIMMPNPIYQPFDYKQTGSPYCGIVISYSPIYDKGLPDYFQ